MATLSQRGRKKYSSNSVDGLPPESPRDRSLASEFDRKLATLTAQLEEKSEQSITMQQQADLDLRLILDLQEVALLPSLLTLPSLYLNASAGE